MFHTLRPLLTAGGAYSHDSPEYRAYVVIKWAAIKLLLDYSLIAFCLLDFGRAWTVWRSWYFYGHVAMAVAWVVTSGAAWWAPPQSPPAGAVGNHHVKSS